MEILEKYNKIYEILDVNSIYIGNVIYHLELLQSGEWKKWEENSQYPYILYELINKWGEGDLFRLSMSLHITQIETINYIYDLIKE